MPLTRDQVSIIKATVPILKEHGNAITTTFYSTLLKENPDLNNVFNTTNQENNHQPAALAGALYAYAAHIDELGVLSPTVERICQKHVSLYIRPEQYDIVGKYLLRAMGDVLGAALTPDVLAAWGEAYWQLANLMIKREADLYSQASGWDDWRDFKIAQKVSESSEITSFYLEAVSSEPLPSFLPGQYISLMIYIPDFGYMQSRQYSLSDASNPHYYRISVKKEIGAQEIEGKKLRHGYVSNALHAEKNVGDIVKVSRPAGEFFCDVDNTSGPVVLISAGVGVTPMLAILNTFVEKQQTNRKVSWIHATRSSEVQAFANHIQAAVAANPENINTAVFNKNPREDAVEGVDYRYKDRMHLEILDKEKDLHIGSKDATYYVCGPASFMADMSYKLKEFGVDEDRIRAEVFGTGAGKA